MNFLQRSFICASRFRQRAALPRGLEEFFEKGVSLPKEQEPTGRAWRASELRNKSFDDLHKLWYVLLKERNLLSTQIEEAKRSRLYNTAFTNKGRMLKCKKSMARIKTILTERYLAQQAALEESKTPEATESNPSTPSTESKV
ncbi:54S ribosomal protein L4 mitochondrial [Dispira parvispora]|uniref:Large ribosomal subunit protein uL29m n=1 Tax=Dispira parvispora TaxID=1520584 RepID=A0A9W8AYB9_9FUNG|nr:54S ribosomal protein L4 mitochondrial [Dispira parvispora]